MRPSMVMLSPRFMPDHFWTRRHVSDYVDDELGAGERSRVEHHIHRCPQCRALLHTLQETVQALGQLSRRPHPALAESIIARLRRC